MKEVREINNHEVNMECLKELKKILLLKREKNSEIGEELDNKLAYNIIEYKQKKLSMSGKKQ